jgi:hypothetical protein
MERKMKRILTVLALSLALTLSAVFVPAATNTAYAQPDRGGLLTDIPVTGVLENDDAFEGLLTITEFVFDGEQLLASGTVTDAAGELVGTFTGVLANLTGGGQGQQRECQILFLDLGPIFLDVLGLQVDLSQIVLDITAVTGPGRLLGNLLCALVGILDGGPLAGINNLLRNINRLLG